MAVSSFEKRETEKRNNEIFLSLELGKDVKIAMEECWGDGCNYYDPINSPITTPFIDSEYLLAAFIRYTRFSRGKETSLFEE